MAERSQQHDQVHCAYLCRGQTLIQILAYERAVSKLHTDLPSKSIRGGGEHFKSATEDEGEHLDMGTAELQKLKLGHELPRAAAAWSSRQACFY